QLLKVPKLGPKAFEQCAGFMRITDGSNPLDATSVHPESYEATMQLLDKLGLTMEDIKEIQKQAAARNGQKKKEVSKKPIKKQMVIRNTNTAMGKALAAAMAGQDLLRDESHKQATQEISCLEKRVKDKKKMAEELGIGEPTLTDILKELEKPARDPREDMPKPILRSDILEMKDLKQGMILKGTVRNVIDFGAFVDIGVHQDGLVHISQITDKYIKHPLEAVSIGDVVDVQVLSVDMAKKRIGLTMKLNNN
ncbi:MAG: S1 RNA-binding domain-containing protein, partial [Lachnospiraceae bacterium]